MTFALIKDGVVTAYPYSLTTFKETNPKVSLPAEPTEAQLNEQDIYTVYPTPQPVYNPILQNQNEGTPECIEGKWYQTWMVSPATAQEIEYRETNAKSENGLAAVNLLKESDWAEVPSVSNPEMKPYLENVQEWLEYRAALRKIAIQPPVEVTEWPQKPSEQWSL